MKSTASIFIALLCSHQQSPAPTPLIGTPPIPQKTTNRPTSQSTNYVDSIFVGRSARLSLHCRPAVPGCCKQPSADHTSRQGPALGYSSSLRLARAQETGRGGIPPASGIPLDECHSGAQVITTGFAITAIGQRSCRSAGDQQVQGRDRQLWGLPGLRRPFRCSAAATVCRIRHHQSTAETVSPLPMGLPPDYVFVPPPLPLLRLPASTQCCVSTLTV